MLTIIRTKKHWSVLSAGMRNTLSAAPEQYPALREEYRQYTILKQRLMRCFIRQSPWVALRRFWRGALRMDMLTPELREIMPFDSIKEAWEVIYEKAENGCAVCQYMIGNA